MNFFFRMNSGVGASIAGVAIAMLTSLSGPAVAASQGDRLATMEAALDAWRMDEVGAMLPGLPHTVGGDYLRGIAANRANDIDASRQALLRALPALEREHSPRTVQALLVLADDYRKSSSYSKQASTLRLAVSRYADQMKPGMLDGVRTDLALASALSGSPPQTVSLSGESRVPIRRNPLGTFDVDVVANGVDAAWMLDSGANYSIVSASFARRLGLDVKGDIGEVASSTEIAVSSKVAVVKEIRLGSATLRNVVVLVVDDEHLHIQLPHAEHQISAALGYPVFQALGRVSFIGDEAISIGSPSLATGEGARLYMNELTPVALLGVEGVQMPFSLDTGANVTDLSYTYWMTVKDRASDWPRKTSSYAGLGGAKTRETAIQPEWRAFVGSEEVVLKEVDVKTQRGPGEGPQPMFGNLGQNLWRDASGFTIDFRAMRFRIDR
ncbi:retropepsin-like aspartic protease [Mitsuaria sp. CC2]|uniref:retropepsin-like aspartic protease family protein n=1 Tax=Mitsuaria sp. CC2 TaxID=3029186 RepID=UPI003B8E283C